MAKTEKRVTRYGIGELFGENLEGLSWNDIQRLGHLALESEKPKPCRFRGSSCHKAGGVCTLRLYEKRGEMALPCSDDLVTICPSRFLENGIVFSWVAREILKAASPIVLSELPFLVSKSGKREKPVGKIDNVLVVPKRGHLNWCALEMQAVYFSGKAMRSDFNLMKNLRKEGIPFPTEQRRPDFRSSGPKRLMPQLQVKVPTISRWGKKTAVVVDLPFWESVGEMIEVGNISNCDIAWFVVNYKKNSSTKQFEIREHSLHLTTLERAVEGLTGGVPTSLEAFEADIRRRLAATPQWHQTI
jgi:hypothetical protein